MYVVGLTGGIGAGKSTVANLFAKYHVPIIDTDVIARQLLEPNTPAYQAVIAHFGKDILTRDNQINRATLREHIFNHEQERLWLENLLHPLIREEAQQQIKHLSADYCLVIIPLLYDTNTYPFLQRYLVVDAPENLQIARTQQRDNIAIAQITAIMQTQIAREKRLGLAHDIIHNDSSLENLADQVDKLHHLYLQLASKAVPP